MIADPRFIDQPESFWALVRSLSEQLGYTHRAKRGEERGSGAPKIHTVAEMADGLVSLGLNPGIVISESGEPTGLGKLLEQYFAYRADTLTNVIEPNLMDKDEAATLFYKELKRLKPKTPIPLNKQKGEKREPAYLTGLVVMHVESAIGEAPCDFNPMKLTTFTRGGVPVRTLSRRVDGAFPSTINPLAIWEIKEYYFTTTFGSRVADGVYETMLDGMELRDLERSEAIRAQHVLFIDSRYTWWVCGKSYLCRIVDLLNMGLVSEVVVGREVVARVGEIASSWIEPKTPALAAMAAGCAVHEPQLPSA